MVKFDDEQIIRDLDLSPDARSIHIRHLEKLRIDILKICNNNKLNALTTTVAEIVKLIQDKIQRIKTEEIINEENASRKSGI